LSKLINTYLNLIGKTAGLVLLVAALTAPFPVIAQPSSDIADVADVESTFKFVANVLATFRRTGRLLDAIGIDGSEYLHFIQLLESSYGEFTRDFSVDSEFCQFYQDPQNGIMEIEERAMLGFQYLPGLQGRQEYFQRLHLRFEEDVQESYGGQVLERIRVIKADITSFEYLPTRDLDPAETVNFADTACR